MHMLTHSGEKPFSCTQCNYTCTQASSPKKHILTHAGEKPFSCTQCEFSCTTASYLKKHMLIHSGEKPFRCNQCNYCCAQTGDLRSHMLTHTGEKPFACKQCSYSYRRSKDLKSHTLVRNLLPASNVITPANSRRSWRNTWESTPQKEWHEKPDCLKMFITLNYWIPLTVSSWCFIMPKRKKYQDVEVCLANPS